MEDYKIGYEAAIDLLIIGTFGIYFTLWEGIFVNTSSLEKNLFIVLIGVVVFSVSYLSRSFLVYDKDMTKHALVLLLIILFLLICIQLLGLF